MQLHSVAGRPSTTRVTAAWKDQSGWSQRPGFESLQIKLAPLYAYVVQGSLKGSMAPGSPTLLGPHSPLMLQMFCDASIIDMKQQMSDPWELLPFADLWDPFGMRTIPEPAGHVYAGGVWLPRKHNA